MDNPSDLSLRYEIEDDLSFGEVCAKRKIIKRNVDVAIIGNGPSAIFLSLLLSGYRPYFNGQHPNPFLKYKLDEQVRQSVIDQDLQHLSEGLEGRSRNQLALLMDTLLHPNADVGEKHPSALSWEYDQSKAVSHVVIGTGKPGGSWHDMKSNIPSLSLGSWLELPIYTIKHWCSTNSKLPTNDLSSQRVSLSNVAQYYTDYVQRMNLEKNMIDGVRVTNVRECPTRPICTVGSPSCSSSRSSLSPDPESINQTTFPTPPFHTVDSGVNLSQCAKVIEDLESSRESSPDISCFSDSEDAGVYCSGATCGGDVYKWCLKGSSTRNDQQDIVVRANNVVLACGVGENPKRLGVKGENNSFITHQFSEFNHSLDSIDRSHTQNPVLIVGTGLTAADAVLLSLRKGQKVVHVFRQDPNDPSLIYNKMHHTLYPEYRRLLSLMKGEELSSYYTPASQCRVSEFAHGNTCVYENSRGEKTLLTVSMVGVLIGSEAELGFLPRRIRSHLGMNPDLPIHSKTNPVDVDPLTFETESFPSMYAIGPLVGDNFVRFVLGSGLGVCKHLTEKLRSI